MPLQDWSAEGRFLLFERNEESTGINDLWVMPVVGRQQAFPFLQTAFRKLYARFSPNGLWVAYGSNESGKSEVYVQSFPNPRTRRLVSTNGGSMPRWRHDGKELYYLSADEHVMVVTVDSVRRSAWLPKDPCSSRLTPGSKGRPSTM